MRCFQSLAYVQGLMDLMPEIKHLSICNTPKGFYFYDFSMSFSAHYRACELREEEEIYVKPEECLFDTSTASSFLLILLTTSPPLGGSENL